MGQYPARGRKFFLIVTIIFIIDAIPTPRGDGNSLEFKSCARLLRRNPLHRHGVTIPGPYRAANRATSSKAARFIRRWRRFPAFPSRGRKLPCCGCKYRHSEDAIFSPARGQKPAIGHLNITVLYGRNFSPHGDGKESAYLTAAVYSDAISPILYSSQR